MTMNLQMTSEFATFVLLIIGFCGHGSVFANTKTDMSSEFTYNSSESTWSTARDACAGTSGTLPVLGRNASAATIALVKTDIGMKRYFGELWTGDYTTFEVTIPKHDGSKNVTGLLCGSAILSTLTLSPGSSIYVFNMTATNCSERHKVICKCNLGNNTSIIYMSKSSSSDWLSANITCWSHDHRCTLWEPSYTLLKMADGYVIGHVTVTLGGNEINQLQEQYWFNMILQDGYGASQADENVLHCGYMTYLKPRVLYGPCNIRRGYICETERHDNESSHNVQAHIEEKKQDDKLPAAAYVGTVIAGVLVVGIGILAGWFWKKRREVDGSSVVQSKDVYLKPHGGRSFKPSPKNKDTKAGDAVANSQLKRITNYNQINPADLEHRSNDDDSSPAYASVQLSQTYEHNTPKMNVEQTNVYLPMDGQSISRMDSIDEDNTYDSLCHSTRRNNEFGESLNTYGMASGGVDMSEYSTTLDRKSSRKVLADYDYVAPSHTPETMNNRVCHSEELVYYNDSTQMALQNPSYEKMEIS